VLTVELLVFVFSLHRLEIGHKLRLSNHRVILYSPSQFQISRTPLILLQILLLKSGNSRAMEMLRARGLSVRLHSHRNVSMVEWVVSLPILETL